MARLSAMSQKKGGGVTPPQLFPLSSLLSGHEGGWDQLGCDPPIQIRRATPPSPGGGGSLGKPQKKCKNLFTCHYVEGMKSGLRDDPKRPGGRSAGTQLPFAEKKCFYMLQRGRNVIGPPRWPMARTCRDSSRHSLENSPTPPPSSSCSILHKSCGCISIRGIKRSCKGNVSSHRSQKKQQTAAESRKLGSLTFPPGSEIYFHSPCPHGELGLTRFESFDGLCPRETGGHSFSTDCELLKFWAKKFRWLAKSGLGKSNRKIIIEIFTKLLLLVNFAGNQIVHHGQ